MQEMSIFGSAQSTGGILPKRVFLPDDVISLTLGSTSRGNQEKYKTVDGKYYIKSRFEYMQHLWKDNLVEVVASAYASKCSFPKDVKVVRQGICTVGVKDGSYSEAFDREGSIFIPFSRAAAEVLDRDVARIAMQNTESWVTFLIDSYSDIIDIDATQYLMSMLLLDLVVANEDRHLGNFGFCQGVDNANLGFSTLFDFGLGLFEHDTKYYADMPLDRAMKRVRIKPWGFKISNALDYLESKQADLLMGILPKSVEISDFEFPSVLAKDYFIWINERLGVNVGGV